MHNLIKIENLTIYADELLLIDNLSINIMPESTVLVLSDNGLSIKYLLKSIAGIHFPDSGNLMLDNSNIYTFNKNEENDIRKRISFVFEKGALLSNLDLEKNLLLTLDFHFPNEPYERKISRIKAFLHDFELDLDLSLRPSQIKEEQIKLLGFIRSLLSEPSLVIYDEPFRYTDANTKKIIIRKMRELKANNITQIIKTQFNEEFVKHCDIIYYIKKGKLFFSGNIKDFIDSQIEL